MLDKMSNPSGIPKSPRIPNISLVTCVIVQTEFRADSYRKLTEEFDYFFAKSGDFFF